MDYNAPSGSTDANAPYVGATASTQGSKIPPKAAEYPQREIVNAITSSGQTPSNTDLFQLWKAMLAAAKSFAGGLFIVGRTPTRYSVPGTYTYAVAAGRSFDISECRGPGGGGGGCASSSYAAAGGGGGGLASKAGTAITDTVLQVIVGAGGVGGAAGGGRGSAGGTTSVSVLSGSVKDINGVIFTAGQTLCAATGGGGGEGAASGYPTSGQGTAGVASGGDLNRNGNIGNYSLGSNGTNVQGGLGGASPGSAAPGPNLNAPGNTSTDPGSGANGASANAAGGDGSNGQVTIYQ